MVREAAGLKQTPGDVVGEGPEAQDRAVQMFEAAVDRPRQCVAGAEAVGEREHIGVALLQCPAELA